MKGLKASIKYAQKIKEALLSGDFFEKELVPKKESEYIIFPIKDESSLEAILDSIKDNKNFDNVDFDNIEIIADIDFKKSARETLSLKEALTAKLSSDEMTHLKTAFDTVGDIAILEIDDVLRNKENLIAETLLSIQKQIKVVCRKDGSHEGEFRTQKMKVLAGEERLETVHRENGVLIMLNVEDVYFSPRLSTERLRINNLVRPKEDVLVMFSGSGVYPVNIAKNTKAKHVTGVEINPEGHKYALINKKLNKLNNVEFYNGDVKDILPTFSKKFDRILMPLPKSAEDFLDVALSVSKSGTVIHFYDFLNESEFNLAHEKIKNACRRNGLSSKILDTIMCGQHAPHVYRICVDFLIL